MSQVNLLSHRAHTLLGHVIYCISLKMVHGGRNSWTVSLFWPVDQMNTDKQIWSMEQKHK